MPTSSLPEDIKELLNQHIESVGQLEALFIFYDFPEQRWTPVELSRELRSNTTSAAKQILHLTKHGFITSQDKDISFIYAPSTPNLAHNVSELRKYYKEMSVSIIAYIYEKPKDKLKTFADAFKLRKD